MLDVNRRLLDLVDALNQSTCAFFESNFEIWRSIDREYSLIKIADVCERKLFLVTTRHSIILSDEHVDKSFFIVMELLRLGQMRVLSTSAPFSIEIDVS